LILAGVLACSVVTLPASFVGAANGLTLVTSQAALGGSDFVDWKSLGPLGTQIPQPFTIASNGGRNATVSKALAGPFLRAQFFSSPDFPELPLLDTNDDGDTVNPIVLDFGGAPVGAVGTHIRSGPVGPFTARIEAFDSTGNSLGSFTLAGNPFGIALDTGDFIGVRSTEPIRKIAFSIADTAKDSDFFIHGVSFSPFQNAPPTDITLSNSSVAENQPMGTAIGNLAAVDPNGSQTHSFVLVAGDGSTDNASFQIVGNQLQTKAVFDFETKASYSILVRATDSGSPAQFFEKSFTITITDVVETCFDQPANAQAGSSRSDVIIGTTTGESIRGGAGADRLCGLGGNDTIMGDLGDDQIDGGAGNDVLDGGFGDDVIIGGPGQDQIRGGLGNDSIQAVDGQVDRIDCGLGFQDSVEADTNDIIEANCEKVVRH
jgi:Ca2+-binding RTX toxin-like protein